MVIFGHFGDKNPNSGPLYLFNDGKDLVFLVKCYYLHVDLGPKARFAIVTLFLGVFNPFS